MARSRSHVFHGLELPIRNVGGARALRIVHPAGQVIPSHRHDWPLLTLPALGSYQEECDDGSVAIDGPAAVLHPAGVCHANCIHHAGMETFSIEFDPGWLSPALAVSTFDRSHYWLGGEIPLASRSLIALWSRPQSDEKALRHATAVFLARAMAQQQSSSPHWLEAARAELASGGTMGAIELARRLDMHPRWVAHAYRNAVGEGLQDTLRRRRVEHAVRLLRSTDEPIAGIAAASGFCDQSHLNRALRRLTGRTPVQIRSERDLLDQLIAG